MTTMTPGQAFRQVLPSIQELAQGRTPLQIVGTINAYTALMASQIGHQAIYISGGACANASYGLPDLGMTSMNDVLEDARRITAAVATPLMVDIDTGWGGAFNIARTIKEMIRADVAAVHIEDQIAQKRCGHRPNKQVVTIGEMQDRIKAATDARTDESFFIMARTDAYGIDGLDAAIERAQAYLAAGADGIFAEAMHNLDDYQKFSAAINAPLLANMTEFGQTPLFNVNDLAGVGVTMALYPLTAARAMHKAAEQVYQTLLKEGDQNSLVSAMQTREELYAYLNYHSYEQTLDKLYSKENKE